MTENNTCGTGGCGCSGAATIGIEDNNTVQKTAKREIDVEFLYLDLNVCQPCQGSEASLDEALNDVAALLEKTGVAVNVRKTHVESYEQALSLGFVSSPTIRVNGHDVQLDVKENYCASCSELSGEHTDCRVWVYQGKEYSSAPKGLIIESVLKEIYGSQKNDTIIASADKTMRSLDNLKRFFKPNEPEEAAASCGCG